MAKNYIEIPGFEARVISNLLSFKIQKVTAPPVRFLHNLRKFLRLPLLSLSKMLTPISHWPFPNTCLKSLQQKLHPNPLSSTEKENSQPGFELAQARLSNLPVQHLITRPFCDLLAALDYVRLTGRAVPQQQH